MSLFINIFLIPLSTWLLVYAEMLAYDKCFNFNFWKMLGILLIVIFNSILHQIIRRFALYLITLNVFQVLQYYALIFILFIFIALAFISYVQPDKAMTLTLSLNTLEIYLAIYFKYFVSSNSTYIFYIMICFTLSVTMHFKHTHVNSMVSWRHFWQCLKSNV